MGEGTGQHRTRHRALVAGVAGAIAMSGLWVGLTAATGKTYHLAPAVVALTPGLVLRLEGGVAGLRLRLLAAALGLLAAAAGWTAITLAGVEPHATLFDSQPGGVGGEVVAGAVAGAIAGTLLAIGAAKRTRTS